MDGRAGFDRPAAAYDLNIGRYAAGLSAKLIAAAGVMPGQTAVDVGYGPGALATALNVLLGAENVAAVDPSDSFVEACRARNPGVRVEVASAEFLPFADGQFDHALAQLVVNFMTDAHTGVNEMRRVTRRGGAVTAAVWDYGEGMTLLRSFWDAAAEIKPGAEALDEGRNMAYSTPAELRVLWSDVGLAEVDVIAVEARAGYRDYSDLWSGLEAGAGPAGAYVAKLAQEERAPLRDELRRRLSVPDGPFELSARAWVVIGRA